MNIFKLTEKAMGMSDDTWKKHANPISGWTRFATTPLILLAFWYRSWIAVGILVIWIWINPRAFPSPKSINNWMSKGVLGEKIFVNRKKNNTKIAKHHLLAATITAAISGLGLIPTIYGLVYLDLWMTVLGSAIVIIGKLWFLDRMVWIYEEHKSNSL